MQAFGQPTPPPAMDAARQGHETPGGGMALRGPSQHEKRRIRQ